MTTSRIKQRIELTLSSSSQYSSAFSVAVGAWFTVEVPDADKGKTVSIQAWSYIQETWITLFALSDTTLAFKGLSGEQVSIIGPLDRFRLDLGANAAANSTGYIYTSS